MLKRVGMGQQVVIFRMVKIFNSIPIFQVKVLVVTLLCAQEKIAIILKLTIKDVVHIFTWTIIADMEFEVDPHLSRTVPMP